VANRLNLNGADDAPINTLDGGNGLRTGYPLDFRVYAKGRQSHKASLGRKILPMRKKAVQLRSLVEIQSLNLQRLPHTDPLAMSRLCISNYAEVIMAVLTRFQTLSNDWTPICHTGGIKSVLTRFQTLSNPSHRPYQICPCGALKSVNQEVCQHVSQMAF
jgi:hypothetical protein